MEEKCGFRVSAYFCIHHREESITVGNKELSRAFRAESAPQRDDLRKRQLAQLQSGLTTFRELSVQCGIRAETEVLDATG